MPRTIATMITISTYGMWLRGDHRGWIERGGRLMPPAPNLEQTDANRLKQPPFTFTPDQLHDVGDMIGRSLINRLDQTILGMTVESWHAHFVIGAAHHHLGAVVKCAKDAVRHGLKPGRPIWCRGYDKRFCFDEQAMMTRIRYVERHNERAGLGPRPYEFITDINEYLASIRRCPHT